MWDKPITKTLFTLNVGGYSPEITRLTYPLLRRYARRIGANFHVIAERKFPKWPVTYEKLQIWELAQRLGSDWNIYVDSDVLVHPETIDFTPHLPRDTVAHNDRDMAAVRWRYDRFFLRDGRNIGSCNWLAVASDWCVDLWRPLDDLTVREALANIRPTVDETCTVVTREHLIDDYALSRNIAKYGLKCATLKDVLARVGLPDANYFWHAYTIPAGEKAARMREVLSAWRVEEFLRRGGEKE